MPFAAGQTQTFQFDDEHGPSLANWGLIEPGVAAHFNSNAFAGLGKLHVPDPYSTSTGIPEPPMYVLLGTSLLGLLGYGWRYNIRHEIGKVESGAWPKDDNPLKNAPHTAASLLKADWPHAHSREEAAYPVAALRQQKYWSPVGRVDNV